MKLVYIPEAQRYMISKDKSVARICGCTFFEDIKVLLDLFKNNKPQWEDNYKFYPISDIRNIIGDFDSKEDIDDVFAEYLI